MKLLLLYKALTGEGLGEKRSNANLFIINNNKTGKAQVWGIGDLIEKTAEVAQNASVTISPSNKSITDMTELPNKWVQAKTKKGKSMDAARIRISNLLAELHKRKVSAGINKMIF